MAGEDIICLVQLRNIIAPNTKKKLAEIWESQTVLAQRLDNEHK